MTSSSSASSFSASALSRIKELNSDNFLDWRLGITSLIDARGLSRVISTSPSARVAQMIEGKESKEDSERWEREDKEARAIIVLSIGADDTPAVRRTKTAYEAWSCICQKHEEAVRANKVALRSELQMLQYKDGEEMQKFLNRFHDIAHKLAGVDEEIRDSELINMLLAAMPISFHPLITSLRLLSHSLPLQSACNQLLAEAQYQVRQRSKVASTEGERVFVVKEDQGKGGQGNKGRKRVRCDHCGRLGHPEETCWQKHPELLPPAMKKRKENADKKEDTAVVFYSSVSHLDTPSHSEVWLVDCAASAHFCQNRDLFTNFSPTSGNTVTVADGRTLPILGRGDISIRIKSSNDYVRATVTEVQYVPSMGVNLLSVSAMTDAGLELTFVDNVCVIRIKKPVPSVLTVVRKVRNKLYQVDIEAQPVALAAATSATGDHSTTDLWHRRLGHLHADGLIATSRLVTDLNVNRAEAQRLSRCETCIKGKSHRAPFPKSATNRATEPLALIHSDLCGPMPTESVGGAVYFITFIDDFSRYCTVYVMETKDEALRLFQKFKAYAES